MKRRIRPSRATVELIAWVVNQTLILKSEADDLWDALDAPQPVSEFNLTLAKYNHVCDQIDDLEKHAQCARYGHTGPLTDPSHGGPYRTCIICGKRFDVGLYD